jgi:deazaflavin-dependent oxidoreductase (nitroreductase family)
MSADWTDHIRQNAALPFLYVTTTGRKTGLPREIEIWFTTAGGCLYLLAEHFERAHWVRNIRNEPRVKVRLGGREFSATGRVLDRERDREAWELAQRLGLEKYGWGDGLPVEITAGEPD